MVRDAVFEANFTLQSIPKLEDEVDKCYVRVSSRVLDIFMNQYHIGQHILALKNYLLLGRGDFIKALLDNLR